jgi:hypothetical protein
MGSVLGFRCGVCRAEVLVASDPGGLPSRVEWTPPILCCGQPLRPIEPELVTLPQGTRRRVAQCPRCGYEVRLIVHPAGHLGCMLCQTDFAILGERPRPVDQTPLPVAPVPEIRG